MFRLQLTPGDFFFSTSARRLGSARCFTFMYRAMRQEIAVREPATDRLLYNGDLWRKNWVNIGGGKREEIKILFR